MTCKTALKEHSATCVALGLTRLRNPRRGRVREVFRKVRWVWEIIALDCCSASSVIRTRPVALKLMVTAAITKVLPVGGEMITEQNSSAIIETAAVTIIITRVVMSDRHSLITFLGRSRYDDGNDGGFRNSDAASCDTNINDRNDTYIPVEGVCTSLSTVAQVLHGKLQTKLT